MYTMPDWKKMFSPKYCHVCGVIALQVTDHGWACDRHRDTPPTEQDSEQPTQ